MKNYITDNGKKEPTILGTIFAGGAAGISNWLIGMPADVLKSRLQTGECDSLFLVLFYLETFCYSTGRNISEWNS